MTNLRKIKALTLTVDGVSFSCQVREARCVNNTDDGDRFYAFCGEGGAVQEIREEADPDWSLEATLFSDWKLNGFNDFCAAHDQETVDFVLDLHPDVPAEHVRRTGQVKVRATDMGGEARANDETEISWPIVGRPTYSRPGGA